MFRTLRVEHDEYSSFALEHGRVAVKVIDQRGNEVMRVLALRSEEISQ